MRVGVCQGFVHVLVAMRLGAIPGKSVFVAMVSIVAVRVIVDQTAVEVSVAVALGQMQPDAAGRRPQICCCRRDLPKI